MGNKRNGKVRSINLPKRLGKGTEELRTNVPLDVRQDFERTAAELEITVAQLLRNVVLEYLYGSEHAQMLLLQGMGLSVTKAR